MFDRIDGTAWLENPTQPSGIYLLIFRIQMININIINFGCFFSFALIDSLSSFDME